MSKAETNFLDTTVSKVDNKLRAKMHVKPTDRYLHNKSEHSDSTKKSIAYSQALRFKNICYNRSNLHNNYKRLLNTLTKTGYNKADITTQINCVITIPTNKLISKIKISNSERLPVTVTYSRTLPDLKTVIEKNWQEIFAETPIFVFNRSKNLKYIIGGNKFFHNKKF